MSNSISNLVEIQKEIKKKKDNVRIIAVSKTFPITKIIPIINHGHIDYGENKVQEAVEKWTNLKNDFKNIKLHFIGKLQSNKVKHVIPLFDYIHSLDTLKLAQKISEYQKKNDKRLKIFIQVNIGNEEQKNGVEKDDLKSFYDVCVNDFNLDIIGLMCLPPNDENTSVYFSEMKILSKNLGLKELSMGMSNDYLLAVENNSTFVRIGSKIFGTRN